MPSQNNQPVSFMDSILIVFYFKHNMLSIFMVVYYTYRKTRLVNSTSIHCNFNDEMLIIIYTPTSLIIILFETYRIV